MDMAAIEAAWAKLGDAERTTIEENLERATGGAARTHALLLMAELAEATGPGGPPEDGEDAAEARIVASLEAAMALAPRDPLEGMLVVQMTAVHAAALRCLARAAGCAEYPHIEARYLREAARLLNLFTRQAEALDRRAGRLGRKACSRHAPPGEADDGSTIPEPEGEPDDAEILELAIDCVRADLGLVKPPRRWDGQPNPPERVGKVPRPPADELRRRRGRAGGEGGKGRC